MNISTALPFPRQLRLAENNLNTEVASAVRSASDLMTNGVDLAVMLKRRPAEVYRRFLLASLDQRVSAFSAKRSGDPAVCQPNHAMPVHDGGLPSSMRRTASAPALAAKAACRPVEHRVT